MVAELFLSHGVNFWVHCASGNVFSSVLHLFIGNGSCLLLSTRAHCYWKLINCINFSGSTPLNCLGPSENIHFKKYQILLLLIFCFPCFFLAEEQTTRSSDRRKRQSRTRKLEFIWELKQALLRLEIYGNVSEEYNWQIQRKQNPQFTDKLSFFCIWCDLHDLGRENASYLKQFRVGINNFHGTHFRSLYLWLFNATNLAPTHHLSWLTTTDDYWVVLMATDDY